MDPLAFDELLQRIITALKVLGILLLIRGVTILSGDTHHIPILDPVVAWLYSLVIFLSSWILGLFHGIM